MNDEAALERWYRRLLTWYPAEHRRTYGEEMIGVLLASTPKDRRRPRLADVVDLVKGGLRARLRPVGHGSADVGWRDTFAVFSIAAPAMALGYFLITRAVFVLNVLVSFPAVQAGPLLGGAALSTLGILLVIALPPLLALRGLRWTAVVVASVAAAVLTIFVIQGFAIYPSFLYSGLAGYWLFSVLEVVSLALSPGPRRGAAIVTASSWCVVGTVTGLAGLAISLPGLVLAGPAASMLTTLTLAAIVVAAAVGLVLTLPAPIGPRLLLLLAVPGYPTAIFSGFHGWALFVVSGVPQLALELLYLPTIALICLVAVLAWRSGRRGRAADG